MTRRGTGRYAVALLAAVLVAWGTGTAYASNEWPHEDMSGFADPYCYNMAYKPGTDVIGCATFKMKEVSGVDMCVLGYWEYDTSTSTWSGGDVSLPGPAVIGVYYPLWVAIDYVDANRLVIAYSFKSPGGSNVCYGELGVVEGFYSVYSGWTWAHYPCVDHEECHGWQYEYNAPHIIAYHGFGSVDVACDQRPGHIGEYHVLYTAAYWQYYSQQMYLDGIHANYYNAVFAKHGVHGSGVEPEPQYPDREILDEVGPEPYIGSASPWFRCSVEASALTAPLVVFEDCRLSDDPAVVCRSTWSDVEEEWASPVAFAWGEFPSLALDPTTANPRVLLSLPDSGLYYTASEDGGATWSWYQTVDEDALGGGRLDIRNNVLGIPVIRATHEHFGTLYASEYSGGTWALTDMVAEDCDSQQRILVNPGSATDPWVMCRFDGGIGLGWNGPPEGCGTVPMQRGMSGIGSGWKAALPLGLALLALAGWRFRRGWRGKADA